MLRTGRKIMASYKVIIICAIFNVFASAGKLPEYIHVCQRSDPDVAKCIKESIESIKPYLKKGIPEVEVPALEPFHLDNIRIFREGDGNNLKAGMKNVDVYGASDFKITKLKIDFPHRTIVVGVKIPLLTVIGEYDVNAKVLVIPIEGRGKIHANATNIDGNAVVKYETFKQDGEDYMQFSSLDLDLSIDDYNVHLEKLFDGEPVLGEAANAVLNENKKEIIRHAMPFVEKKVSGILLDAANKIVKTFRYDEVFPKN